MRILYVNISVDNARDRVTIRGLRECGQDVRIMTSSENGVKKFWNIIQMHRGLRNNYDIVIVGYTGGILVPLIRLISKKRVVYNAVSSLYEGMVISRGNGLSLKAPWYYMIDFFACFFAHRITIESQAQKEFLAKYFFVPRSKIIVSYTGVDDKEFYFDPKIQKFPNFTVLFRGKFMPEAGLETLLDAAKLVAKENIKIRIIGRGFLENKIKNIIKSSPSPNVEIVDSFLPFETLRQKMGECHLALGQLSDHPRLLRTIPHKAFEALSMKLPYLTARKGAIMEVINDKIALFSRPGDAKDLAERIIFAKKHPEILAVLSSDGFNLFQEKFTPKKLAEKLLRDLESMT